MELKSKNKAWIVAVNMGYGHQRTAFPLKDLSANSIINANAYEGIPLGDKKIWEGSRGFYEFVSRFKRFPLIGHAIFSLFDKFQKIFSYYPRRDLSKPNLGLRNIFSLIRKGWGENLIRTLSGNPLPFVSTFFVPAFMAEYYNYPNEIYCIICDADIARSWVPLNPVKTRIKYFAPCHWVYDRLQMYGIRPENISLTGYPLPKENIGKDMEIVKSDMAFRILNLDPLGNYRKMYRSLVDEYIGDLPKNPDHPLTIMFSIGGAGAQKEMGIKILHSLSKSIVSGKVRFIFSAGTKEEVYDYLIDNIEKVGLATELNKGIDIIFNSRINDYFTEFNRKLRKTDILWTKPSELSFYSGLGLPILIAPSIGSQEDFNKKWLLRVGAGVVQENPKYAGEWLHDLLDSGRLADAAMQGFIEVEKMGTYNIEKIISRQ